MAANEPIINVSHLVKKYKKASQNAVDSISFSVEKGQFFALLGPNGAGKTTTISILTTTLSKTTGKITIAGFDLDKQSSQVRANIGIIFQKPSLDENLTAEENIRFHAILYGLYPFSPSFSLMPKSYRESVYELSEVIGLKKELFFPIKTYSGGMKRKLEIIRSLMHKPKVLFLDEPTSGLDPVSRKNLWEYLSKIRKEEQMTIFLTTHYLEEADDADKVCIINKGKIVLEGTPDNIKNSLLKNHLIIDSKNRQDLVKELKRLNIPFSENEHLTISTNDEQIQQIIQKIHTPLNLLKIHSPSLEEAYFTIVEKGARE